MKKRVTPWLLLTTLIFVALSGCGVYYNTFYNAKKAFNEAEGERKSTKPGQAERIRTNLYETAIDKSLKVVDNHPNSKYYDDAVYVLGVSYFYTKQYSKAERRFREILTNYPESDFARDSRLYLAKSMLQQEAEDEAMDLFAELFDSDINKTFKAEAAIALGNYQFERGNYKLSNRYFIAIRDTLGNDIEKAIAQLRIADGLLAQWRYADALGAYLQILGMNPTVDQKYHALLHSAEAAYMLQRVDVGQDYLRTLAEDQLYFDSLAILQLEMADGYEWQDRLDKAEELYKKVAEEAPNSLHKARADLMLGLIYQYDYDDLTHAKEFYDAAVTANRNCEWGQQALQLSSDIGKLETFARTIKIDSTTSQDMIDEAAYTQFQLAELYWFKLSKPDTAMIEMQYVVDSFPTAYDAPKAMIAMAQMAWEMDEDSGRGDSILQEMVARYPQSDFLPEALELLGLTGTEADTGYAEFYFRKAEDFLIDEENLDSARAYYQIVVDQFPDSKYYLQARFAQIWMTEEYASPGDSSIYWAYTALADSFPSTPWGTEARNRMRDRPARQVQRTPDQPSDSLGLDSLGEMAEGEEGGPDIAADTGNIDAGKFEAIYTDPDGLRCIDIPSAVQIMQTRKEFEYPSEAYVARWEGELYFQIRLDFSGEVTEIAQKTYSDIEEINIRAQETMLSMVFDMRLIQPEWLNRWFMYKFKVILPSHLR